MKVTVRLLPLKYSDWTVTKSMPLTTLGFAGWVYERSYPVPPAATNPVQSSKTTKNLSGNLAGFQWRP